MSNQLTLQLGVEVMKWKRQAMSSHIEAITPDWRCEFDLFTSRHQSLSLEEAQYNGTWCLALRWELLLISKELRKIAAMDGQGSIVVHTKTCVLNG